MTEPTCGNQPPFDPLRDKPLTVQLLNGTLSIEVGVNVLATMFEEQKRRFYSAVKDPEDLAQGIVKALQREEEDGSTGLTRLFDAASWSAAKNGYGVEQVEE